MKISPTWLREFVALKAAPATLAEELTRAGLAPESIEGEGEQAVMDLEITTNRVDAMNHYGVARECAAIYDLDLKPIQPKLPATKDKAKFAIQIEDREGCARYTARIVRGVTVKPSPAHIAQRLELCGARPINNAADATNYNLMEMGHPTHAFDLDLLEGGRIIVRRAKEGERLKTLDGAERKLSSEDLVIADGKKAVAIAGVIGGFDTMITERTKNVLIESAWFDPVTVRKTARRHGLHTDASHRFERGADFAATPLACARVAQLILETGGGTLEGGEIDAVARRIARPAVWLRHSQVKRILGQAIPEREVRRILDRLGFTTTPSRGPKVSAAKKAKKAAAEPGLIVELPTWRLDVEREIDLIEEIARIYGYDRFPNTLPAFSGAVVELPDAAKDARLRAALLGLGYHEAISLSFITRADAEAFSSAKPVELANPISEEATTMRTSLVPGMLGMLAWNLNRGTGSVRLFESGNVYLLAGAKTEERKTLCLGATGEAHPASPHEAARAYGFFDLKGDVEVLLEAFPHSDVSYDAQAGPAYHPGRSARAVLGGATVARFGQIHPEMATARKLRQDVFVAEIHLDQLYRQALREPRYQAIPRFPAVERDFSFFFDGATRFAEIRSAIAALGLKELASVRPAEVLPGGAAPTGKYSMLVRATFQSSERTLRDDEVAGWSATIVQALQGLGGKLRA
ncbi:MAG TPA: phenylalanine--tRNA ligase subunit beta [Terriglobales bacterium]|nr:phenylalanine--tRNA ligase subunit beta [Terriglobales bacterium]